MFRLGKNSSTLKSPIGERARTFSMDRTIGISSEFVWKIVQIPTRTNQEANKNLNRITQDSQPSFEIYTFAATLQKGVLLFHEAEIYKNKCKFEFRIFSSKMCSNYVRFTILLASLFGFSIGKSGREFVKNGPAS